MFHLSKSAAFLATASAENPPSDPLLGALALNVLLVLLLIVVATLVLVLLRIIYRRRSQRDHDDRPMQRQTPDPWELAGKRIDPDSSDDIRNN